MTFGRHDTDCHSDNGKIAHVFADKFRSMYIMILLAIFLLHRNMLVMFKSYWTVKALSINIA